MHESETQAAWRALRATTVAMFVLILLVAFEALAVTTAMPTVAESLDGRSLYQLAFAGAIATGIVGMVVGGAWSDATSPRLPLTLACAAFAVGLAVAGLATSMEVLVLGRLVQGLGGGAINVCLFVIVGRLYPPALHPRVFAAFSAAWVLPSIVGPLVAGLLTEHVSWRWVFLGAASLTVPVWLALQPALGRLQDSGRAAEPGARGRLLRAVGVSVAMLGLALSPQLAAPASWLLATGCLLATVLAVRGLLPEGALRARRGLPAVVADRAFVSGAFFGAQVYVPYLLTDRYGFSPTAAGVALTTAALTWSSASWVQGRLGARLGHGRAVRVGTTLVAAAIGLVLLCDLTLGLAVPLVAAWTLAGAGMGLTTARLSVLTLAYAEPGRQGAATSALSISDSFGSSAAIAVSGLLFAAVTGAPFVAALALTFGCALVARLLAGRVDAQPSG